MNEMNWNIFANNSASADKKQQTNKTNSKN